jgi:hypothetical protein
MTPRKRGLAVAAVIALGVVIAVRNVARAPRAIVVGDLPHVLADTTFWGLFESMSEDGGFFRSDNFVSNESALQYVIPAVLDRVGEGSVYIGVGPEQNFTYVAALRPRLAFIVDIRRQNALAHLMYKALFELSSDRADFLSRLFARARPARLDTNSSVAALMDEYTRIALDTARFRRSLADIVEHLRAQPGYSLSADDLASIEYVMGAFAYGGPELTYSSGRGGGRRGQSFSGGYGSGMFGMPTFAWLMTEDDGEGVERGFLATEANFRLVQDMQRRNAIVPVVGDFAGSKALRAVGDYVRSHRATVGVFYTSNVEQYLFQSGDAWSRFYENVSRLPITDRSMFIRSVTSRFARRSQHPNARMTQLTVPIAELLRAFRSDEIRSYYDVIDISR